MAHGLRYTQMAHGGFKCDDRGTWVGPPLIPSHFLLFVKMSFIVHRYFVFLFFSNVFPFAGTMLSLFLPLLCQGMRFLHVWFSCLQGPKKKEIIQQQSCMHPVFVKSAGCRKKSW